MKAIACNPGHRVTRLAKLLANSLHRTHPDP